MERSEAFEPGKTKMVATITAIKPLRPFALRLARCLSLPTILTLQLNSSVQLSSTPITVRRNREGRIRAWEVKNAPVPGSLEGIWLFSVASSKTKQIEVVAFVRCAPTALPIRSLFTRRRHFPLHPHKALGC